MGVFVLLVLALSSACVAVEGATWCVPKSNVGDQALQKALDYACGAGADCLPIQQSGACYNPNTVLNHASYAMNSYFQKKGQVQGSCDFSGAATTTTTDPSSGSCVFPSTARSLSSPSFMSFVVMNY
ncbi:PLASMODESMATA CALLOSE-BINDING PROTEIN 3 [Nymphaea thermarum]|nr:PLASMODESMATA CALLOSE-BINDING PROTEIN 3 [Nymphaea thermarum]